MNAQGVIVLLVLLGLSFMVQEFWSRFWLHIASSFGGSLLLFAAIAMLRKRFRELLDVLSQRTDSIFALLISLLVIATFSLTLQAIFTFFDSTHSHHSLTAYFEALQADIDSPRLLVPRYTFLTLLTLWSLPFLSVMLTIIVQLGFLALGAQEDADESGEDGHARFQDHAHSADDYSSPGNRHTASYDLDAVMDLDTQRRGKGYSMQWLRDRCEEQGLTDALARAVRSGLVKDHGAGYRKNSGGSSNAGRKSSTSSRSQSSNRRTGRQKSSRAQSSGAASISPYKVLGISPQASREEIRAAYRELCKKYHPDKVQNLGQEYVELSNKKFKEIQQAFDTLNKKLR